MDLAQLQTIERAGVSFSIQVAVPGGGNTLILSPIEVLSFLDDKDQLTAKHFGVPVEDYLEWVKTDGTPRCGAKTTKGKVCRNFVSGGIQMPLHKWRKLDGGLCAVHGGENSVEANM